MEDTSFENLHFRGKPNDRGDRLYFVLLDLLKKGAISGDELKSKTMDYLLREYLIREFGTLDKVKIKEKLHGN